MATNYKHPGDVVERTAPSGGVTAGTPVVIGNEFLIPLATAAVGVQFSAALTGVWTLSKTTGVAWTNGLALYWNAGTSKVSTVSTDGIYVGTADAAATSAATTGDVRLAGTREFAEGPQTTIAALTDNTGDSGTHDDTLADGKTQAALTENSGAIGGTNDGDLPDLTATAATLTENSGAIGGTNDGDLPALVDPAGDSGASVIAGIRENATAINELVADNVALRAAIRENSTGVNGLVTDVGVQNQNDSDLAQKILEIRTALLAAGILSS